MVWRISAQAESKPTSKIFSGIKLPIADARSQARRKPGPKLLMGPLRRFGRIPWQGRVERRLGAVLSVIRPRATDLESQPALRCSVAAGGAAAIDSPIRPLNIAGLKKRRRLPARASFAGAR